MPSAAARSSPRLVEPSVFSSSCLGEFLTVPLWPSAGGFSVIARFIVFHAASGSRLESNGCHTSWLGARGAASFLPNWLKGFSEKIGGLAAIPITWARYP
jgi:hypothetical protein